MRAGVDRRDRSARGARRTGVRARFPGSLAELNAVFGPWGASFSHAWKFEEASGNAADMATSGAVALAPNSVPTQGVATGLVDGDKGVQFNSTDSASSDHAMRAAVGTDLDVTTGSVFMLLTARFVTAPAATKMVCGKRATNFYELRLNAAGQPVWTLTDGTVTPSLGIGVSHVGTHYNDILMICDRTSASKLAAVCSQLGDSGTTDISTLATITNTGRFVVGGEPATFFFTANFIATFCAWGTVPGTLLANRAAALDAWRRSRGA